MNKYFCPTLDVMLIVLGFLKGWAGNEKCIARVKDKKPGVPLEKTKVVYIEGTDILRDALVNGSVSAY